MANKNNEALKVLTSEFRVSHPHVFKPSQIKDAKTGQASGKPNYSIEMLFPKATTDLAPLKKALNAAIVDKWGPDKNDWPQPLKMPIRDGDKPHGRNREVKPEHKGMWVVRASSDAEYSKPHVVGRDPKVALESEAEFYPGCWARASLKAHAYTFADKDGVKFILDGVQKIRDDKAFGGKKPADQVFGVVEGDDGADIEIGAEEDEESFM